MSTIHTPWIAIGIALLGGILSVSGAVVGKKGLPWSGVAIVLGCVLWSYGLWIVLPWSVK
jgi:hypothetical protein